jgi:hypothetical protein
MKDGKDEPLVRDPAYIPHPIRVARLTVTVYPCAVNGEIVR